MPEPRNVALPGPPVAAASDGATVWCGAAGRLLAYDEEASELLDVEAPPGLRSLAAAGETLAAALERGAVAWLDRREGTIAAQAAVGGDPLVCAGGDAVWAVDRRSGRAWRLAGAGVLEGPTSLGDVDAVAPDGTRIWWTSRGDTLLRGGDHPVDIAVGTDERGGMAACAGSIWIAAAGAFLRVGAWAGELGPPLPAPGPAATLLACAGGILVGARDRSGLLVLDPSVDADVRRLEVDLGADPDMLVTTRSRAWTFASGRAEARVVGVRLGG